MVTLYFLMMLVQGTPKVIGFSETMRDCQYMMVRKMYGDYSCRVITVLKTKEGAIVVPKVIYET